MSSSSSSSPPHVVEDCRGVLRVYSDGSIVRSPPPPSLSPSTAAAPPQPPPPVVWKDVEFDPSHGLHLRLYKPTTNYTSRKLPVFFYFHGGGFCIGSCAWPIFHACSLRLAADLPALVVAPDYRLAPEHPLPAALLDAAAAVDWIRAQAASPSPDPFLADSADFGRVFVSGDSAGGNLAHHLAVRFGSDPTLPNPIRGFVLLMPFFGGTLRTRSEAECPEEAFLTLEQNDRYWRLALPRGATRDHPVANPFAPDAPALDAVEMAPVLVVAAGNDLLRDRDVEYARRLEELGKPVEMVEIQGQEHGFFARNLWTKPADELVRVIRRFVEENGGGASRSA